MRMPTDSLSGITEAAGNYSDLINSLMILDETGSPRCFWYDLNPTEITAECYSVSIDIDQENTFKIMATPSGEAESSGAVFRFALSGIEATGQGSGSDDMTINGLGTLEIYHYRHLFFLEKPLQILMIQI